MKISKREMILFVLALAMVLGGFTWYIVDGKLDEWRAMVGQIDQAKQQAHQYELAIKMQKKWSTELASLQSQLRTFPLSQRSVSPELMKTIKSVAIKYGLDITRSQPYAEKPIGDLFELGINITWTGTLKSIVNFLTELQQQNVRYDVRQLTITPVGKNTPNLKGNMVVYFAYTRVEPKKTTPTPSAQPKPAPSSPPKARPAEQPKKKKPAPKSSAPQPQNPKK